MIDKRINFGGGGSHGPHGGYQGGNKSPGSAESSGSKSNTSNTSNSSGGGGNRPNPHKDSGYSPISTPTKSKSKITTGPTNIHNDDSNAPEAYEIIGGEKFDVTPKTKGERDEARAAVERAAVKQSILDAPIPNITDKGISFFKDGNLLPNFLMAGDNPMGKPKFNLFNTAFNVLGYTYGGPLFSKYQKAKSLYKGAKFAKDLIQPYTTKNLDKPFKVIEGLTKNIGLKNKDVIESFKSSLTSNLVPKRKPFLIPKRKPVTNTNEGDDNGIASLENANALQDEYTTLLQKASLNDEEQVRFNMLKNMLGI